jgi:hypothetical protein
VLPPAAAWGFERCGRSWRGARAWKGFVPVCPEALERWPMVIEYCESRHLCLFTQRETAWGQRGAAAGLLARAARRGARPHLCFWRSEARGAQTARFKSRRWGELR